MKSIEFKVTDNFMLNNLPTIYHTGFDSVYKKHLRLYKDISQYKPEEKF